MKKYRPMWIGLKTSTKVHFHITFTEWLYYYLVGMGYCNNNADETVDEAF